MESKKEMPIMSELITLAILRISYRATIVNRSHAQDESIDLWYEVFGDLMIAGAETANHDRI